MDQKRSGTNHQPERQDNNFLFLPWFVTTKSFVGSWALLLLLLFSGVAALFLRVPVYSTGTGVIADWRDRSDSEARGLVVVAFFPAPMVAHLARGQSLSIDLDGRQLSGPIVDARAKPLDRTAAATEFALTPDAMASISDLSAVAIMKLEAAPAGMSQGLTSGRRVDVNYLLTRRRLGSFFPFIGGFFHD